MSKKNKTETSSEKTSEKNSKTKKSGSAGSKIVKYFRDLKSEFKKVVWPTRKQVFNNTLVVLSTMVLMGIFVGGLDTALYKLLQLLMSKA